MIYVYLVHITSWLTNNAEYTGRTKWDKWVIYELQGAKLRRVFDLLADFVAAALGSMKREPLTRALVELDEQGQVEKSRPHPGTLHFRL